MKNNTKASNDSKYSKNNIDKFSWIDVIKNEKISSRSKSINTLVDKVLSDKEISNGPVKKQDRAKKVKTFFSEKKDKELFKDFKEKKSKKSDFKLKKIKTKKKESYLNNYYLNPLILRAKKLPIKQALALVAVFVLISATLPLILPEIYGNPGEDVKISLEPNNVYVDDVMIINATIPAYYNITSVIADFEGFDQINLELIDESVIEQKWTASWVVPNMSSGEYFTEINAYDKDNLSYSATLEWWIAEEVIEIVTEEQNQNMTEEPLDNDSTTPYENKTEFVNFLNVSISTDNKSYNQNDTVIISGTVTYNDKLVNISVNLSIIGPNETLEFELDVIDGLYAYDFIGTNNGSYSIVSKVSYNNISSSAQLMFIIGKIDKPLEPEEPKEPEDPKEPFEPKEQKEPFTPVKSTTKDKTIYEEVTNAIERVEERTSNSKVFVKPDGSITQKIGIGPIHYRDENGDYQDIDTDFYYSGDPEFDYEVEKGFYKLKIKNNINSENFALYNYKNYISTIQLLDLNWIKNNGDIILVSSPLSSEGHVDGNIIIFNDTYGNGLDTEFLYHQQFFRKVLKIENRNSLRLSELESDISQLEFNYVMKLSNNLDVYVNNERLASSDKISANLVEFKDKKTGETQFSFADPYAEDFLGNRTNIEMTIRKQGSDIFISKRLAKSWLETARYPVIFDPSDQIDLEGDSYDMWDSGSGTNQDYDVDVQIGQESNKVMDGYWAFLISDAIINAIIKSVNFTGYVSQNDIAVNPLMRGLQQEDCPALEGAEDPSTYGRTLASYSWSALNGGGSGTSFTTGDIKSIFNEWISEYGHSSPPDRFGLVLDDSGSANKLEVYFYDFSHSSYSSHTYLIIDYRENTPPTLTGESPVNHSTNIDLTPNLYVICSDADGDTMNATWWSNSSGSWLQFAKNDSISSGTNITQPNTNFTATSQDYWWNLTLEDGNGSIITEWYHLTTRATYTPNAPSSFTATANGRFQIDLSWTDHSYSDTTLVEWNSVEDPTWDPGDHTELYNGTGESTSHTSLDPGTTYYYKAWSWNETDNVWSTGSTDNATTNAHNPPNLHDENPANSSINQDLSLTWNITIDDADGDTFNWWINCSNGQTNSSTGDSDGSKELSITGLTYDTEYIVWANASDSYNQWNYTWYNFTTRSIYTPSAPGSFTAVADGRFEIDLSWDADPNNKTLVRYAAGGTPPASTTEGTELYNDTGASTSLTSLQPSSQYSFAAWTWNITDSVYSESSSTDTATTDSNIPTDHGTPSPANGSANQPVILTWSIEITDKESDTFNWTIECSNGQSNSANNENNGTKQLSLSELSYLTEYKVWVNSTDDYDWNRTWYNFTTGAASNAPTQGNENPTNQSTGKETTPQLSIDVDDANDDTLNASWYSNSSGPWILFGTNLTIDTSGGAVTIYQTNTNFTDFNETYWWSVNITDGMYWTNATYHFTTNIIPTLSGETPVNQSTNINPSPALYVICNDLDSDTMTATWYSNSTGSWKLFATNNSISSGTNITQTNSNFTAYSETYYWAVNLTDGKDSTNNIYYFTTRAAYTPDAPSSFTATTNGRFQIDLSWTDHGYSDTTLVEWNSAEDPSWDPGDHTELYNGTGESTSHTSLDPGTTYYYKAWSWNETDNVWGSGSTDNSTTDSNNPPIISFEFPSNSSTGVSLTPVLNVTVDDSDGDLLTVKWYENTTEVFVLRNTNNSVSTGSNVSYTFTEFDSLGTTYWWKVTANDSYNGWDNETFHFTTIENMNTSVDTISPYMHTVSPLTINATESSEGTPENVTLYYRWSDDNVSWEGGIGDELNNTIDSNTSNVDSSDDIGNETNFANAQDVTPDSDYMNIQENDTNISASQWLDCNGNDSTYTGWTEVGTYPYLGVQDEPTNYIYTSTDTADQGWFYFPNTYLTGTLTVNISIYCKNDDGVGEDYADVFVDYTGSGSGSDVGDIGQHTIWQYDTISLGTHTVSEVNNLRVYFNMVRSTPADDVYIDHVRIGVTGKPPENNEIDFEYQWTTAEATKENEEVCIYVASHTGSEDLNVNYRNGGSWSSLGTISSTGWNNFTAAGLDSSTYTIQLIGATETDDTSQDDWDIDVIMLHTWNTTGGPHGINWTVWNNDSNPDTASPWSWDFDFPNGNGYYEFYSMGKKSGISDETAPASADAICYLNIVLSISLSHASWDIGETWIDDPNPYQTTGDYFTLTNDGTVTVDVTVNATNATNSSTSAKWSISETIGHDQFKLEYQIGAGDWTNINETYGSFTNSLITSVTFDLRIYMATSSSTHDELSFTITFKAVAS